jgi:predicted RNase H-like HicB family nuclease
VYFSVDVFRKDAETYVASCPELDIFSYGHTLESAVERLKRVVSFYLESADEMGVSIEDLGLRRERAESDVPRVSSVNFRAAVN